MYLEATGDFIGMQILSQEVWGGQGLYISNKL